MAEILTPTRRAILDFIVACQRERNFPPTIREIGAHVHLNSSATVKAHIDILKNAGYIENNPKQPRTLTVHWDVEDRATPATITSIRRVPLIGDVAAGTGVLASETEHDIMDLPEQFAGRGESFALQVRGDSMSEAGILPGDYVIVNRQTSANTGDIVVAGIPGEEATVKRYFPQGSRVVLQPANATMEPLEFPSEDVVIFGRVISVLRSY